MYYDLNVVHGRKDSQQSRRALMAAAVRLGFDGVAFSRVVEGPMTPKDACDWRELDLRSVLEALPGGAPTSSQDLLGGGRPVFRQLGRLTLVTGDVAHVAVLNKGNEFLRGYDLIAIQPESLPVFAKACSSLEVDVISLDLSRRLPYRFRPPMLAPALQRGVVFEICYAAALSDPSARTQFFSNAKALVTATRGKGILISSGASRPSDLRAPLDAANLVGLAGGLAPHRARAALSVDAQSLLLRAETRKAPHGGAITVDRKKAGGRAGGNLDPTPPSFPIPAAWDPFTSAGTAEAGAAASAGGPSAGGLNFDVDIRDTFAMPDFVRGHHASQGAGLAASQVAGGERSFEAGERDGRSRGPVGNGHGGPPDYVPMSVDAGDEWTKVQRGGGGRKKKGRGEGPEAGGRGGSPWKRPRQKGREG